MKHYLQYLRKGSNVNVHGQRNGKTYVVDIYTIECYLAIKKNQIMPAT